MIRLEATYIGDEVEDGAYSPIATHPLIADKMATQANGLSMFTPMVQFFPLSLPSFPPVTTQNPTAQIS
jgi:hypothetical protein